MSSPRWGTLRTPRPRLAPQMGPGPPRPGQCGSRDGGTRRNRIAAELLSKSFLLAASEPPQPRPPTRRPTPSPPGHRPTGGHIPTARPWREGSAAHPPARREGNPPHPPARSVHPPSRRSGAFCPPCPQRPRPGSDLTRQALPPSPRPAAILGAGTAPSLYRASSIGRWAGREGAVRTAAPSWCRAALKMAPLLKEPPQLQLELRAFSC